MKRTRAAGFVGAIVLTMAFVAPGAQAATSSHGSTSCAIEATMKFKPALEPGSNPNAFIKMSVKLRGCTGGTVTRAHGYGGSIGNLRCESGRVSGRAAAKAQLYWDTGESSALNFFFDFHRSSLKGQVVDGPFKGEPAKAKHFTLTPVNGDCATSPLVRASLTGILGL